MQMRRHIVVEVEDTKEEEVEGEVALERKKRQRQAQSSVVPVHQTIVASYDLGLCLLGLL
jgi:hypothetical protein